MKNLILAFLLAFAPLSFTVTFTGCTTSQKGIAFKTLSATAATVDSMMSAYSDRVVAGKVDQATQVRVLQAKGNYELAFKLAVESTNGFLDVPTPIAVQQAASELSQLLTALLK